MQAEITRQPTFQEAESKVLRGRLKGLPRTFLLYSKRWIAIIGGVTGRYCLALEGHKQRQDFLKTTSEGMTVASAK